MPLVLMKLNRNRQCSSNSAIIFKLFLFMPILANSRQFCLWGQTLPLLSHATWNNINKQPNINIASEVNQNFQYGGHFTFANNNSTSKNNKILNWQTLLPRGSAYYTKKVTMVISVIQQKWLRCTILMPDTV